MKTFLPCFLASMIFFLAGSPAGALDFGDHASSTLTSKAWDAMGANQLPDAISFAKKCIELYEAEALKMQEELTDYASGGQDAIAEKWALNDVGTCYFILGQIYEKQDKSREALEAYQQLTGKLKFAQCWDVNGWFWKPAEAARGSLKELEFDALE